VNSPPPLSPLPTPTPTPRPVPRTPYPYPPCPCHRCRCRRLPPAMTPPQPQSKKPTMPSARRRRYSKIRYYRSYAVSYADPRGIDADAATPMPGSNGSSVDRGPGAAASLRPGPKLRAVVRGVLYLTPKRCSSGQLYSEGARGTPSGTRRARDKLISVLAQQRGVCSTFPQSSPSQKREGRPCRPCMKASRMG
jgi:hypothetical protein